MSNTRPRVLLADDHAELLRDIARLMAGDFDVVGTAANGHDLVAAARTLEPEVIVTDVRMPGLNGMDAARTILEQDLCRLIVALSLYDDPRLVRKALDAGIRGYVLKAEAGEELIPAVRAVIAGRVYVSARIAPAPDGV
jgi:DNA-binding NarL/FixJ family response regulator